MRVDSAKFEETPDFEYPLSRVWSYLYQFGEAWRMAEGVNASEKLLSFFFDAWHSVCLSASEFSHAGSDDRSDLWCLF